MPLGTFTPKTGNGGAITFATSTIVLSFTGISDAPETLEKLKASHLGTQDFHEYEPGDLKEPPEITVDAWWDASKGSPPLGVPQTVTVTLPKTTGGSTAGNFAGSAFLTAARMAPPVKNGELMSQQIKVAFDGKTGPAYTPEA